MEIVPRQCLDVCLESAAVKLGGEVILVRPEDVRTLEAKVRQAVQ